MKKYGIALVFCVALSGCQLTSQTTKTVDGKKYALDENGSVLMTQEDLQSVLDDPNVKYVPQQRPNGGIMLSQAEYQLALADSRALFTMLGFKAHDEVVSLVLPGSLNNNLKRLLNEQQWTVFVSNGPDMYVDKPYIVKGETVKSVLAQVVADYPVYLRVDEVNKTVAVVSKPEKADYEVVEAMSQSNELVSVPSFETEPQESASLPMKNPRQTIPTASMQTSLQASNIQVAESPQQKSNKSFDQDHETRRSSSTHDITANASMVPVDVEVDVLVLEEVNKFSFVMQPGLLKVQLQSLVDEIFPEYGTYWDDYEGKHEWVGTFEVVDTDRWSMLNDIIRPYNVKVSLAKNDVLVFQYKAKG
jgi:hypothetical protein